MTAVADYVDGEGEPPPELVWYLLTRDWGSPTGEGWGKWPARWFLRVRVARNTYNAWKAYVGAKDRVKWLNENPGAEIVGLVKSYRYGEVDG